MLVKVGELARRTGLTVRTLHHYDSIGLLTPSVRSEGMHRLYNQADVGRLHAIQALRRLGFSLVDIGRVLEHEGEGLQETIARQIRALDQEITQASELRSQLHLLKDRLALGGEPDMSNWLSTLSLMNTYANYFSSAELKLILKNQHRQSKVWGDLFEAVHQAMRDQLAPDSPQVQSLAVRWMNLTLAMMNDDFHLIERWGKMHTAEPKGRLKGDLAHQVSDFIQPAIDLRMDAMLRHMTRDELYCIRTGSEVEIAQITQLAQRLHAENANPEAGQARKLLHLWEKFMLSVCADNPALLEKLLHAYNVEPVLRNTTTFDHTTLEYIQRALKAQTHPWAKHFA